ncbi:MarR family transcriptional regulator [Bdellovibrio bacteriovorus]|uniref:MarR family transcriptional regulator n=1 Tax=Bdellovibrio bacteriovorus TaxID=959 RepID=A0A150WH52_BDEBC|nr:MarR family transcriptional regulator [Bdellovibrio bacteriovorus]
MSRRYPVPPAKEVSHLKEHLGYWMRMVSNGVSHTFARKLESKGVTVAEWVILREMFENQDTTTPSTVAELTGLTRGAVSKLITRLLDKDLVSRKESSDDRRYQDIKLTGKGKNLVPQLAKIADENDQSFFSILTKSERDQLKVLLMKMAGHEKIKALPID